MRISLIAGWATIAVVAASTTGCAAQASVPAVAPPRAIPAKATPSALAKATPSALAKATPSALPALPSECITTERYDLDLAAVDLTGKPTMCFRAGGTLRMQGIGPAELTVQPESLTSVHYEAGVDDVRFVKPGTVTLTFPANSTPRTIVVTVRKG